MLKFIIIFATLLVCCYCYENNDLSVLESRAKKKKNSAKLIGLILLFVFAKVAIFKAVSVFLMMSFFQKLFSLGGVLFTYFMKMKSDNTAPVYGAPQPQNYDTVGYSYGPPEQEPRPHERFGSEVGSSFDWLLNKNT